LIGEIWLPDTARFALYLAPDEMHTAFNFDFLAATWDATELRRTIDATLVAHAPVKAPATWVLSNHDVTRHVTRYGRADTTFSHDPAHRRSQHDSVSDIELGTRRARAAVLLSWALPGSIYIYQGEELGLWEVEEIPDTARQDPMFYRSGGANPGRDGCRVPLPWSGEAPPFGFSPAGAAVEPWLPQPAAWRDFTAEAEAGDPSSMLELYRTALAIRHAEAGLGDGPMTWLDAPDGVLSFTRPGGFGCVVNLSDAPVGLPEHTEILLRSGPLVDGLLPTDSAVWLRTA
jgi:alpha-glucosidase